MTSLTRTFLPAAALAAVALLAAGCSAASSSTGGAAASSAPAAASATASATAVTASAVPVSSPAASSAAVTAPAVTASAVAASGTATAGPKVYLAEGGDVGGPSVYRPACASGCGLSGDGTTALWNMTWTTWDAAEAVGTGTEKIDDCNPNCAAGTAAPARRGAGGA